MIQCLEEGRCVSVQVKVMVRVCPSTPTSAAESSSFLKVDSRKKQVTIMDPAANTQPNQSQKRGTTNQVPPKMFAFDAAFSHDASQVKDLYVFSKDVKRKPLMFKPLI